jgi:hypothetical protein
MAIRFASVVALFGLLLVPAASPFTATAQAQMSASCGQEIARQEAALRKYDADATKAGASFLANDAGNAALSGIKKNLAGDATADALADLEQKYQDYKGFLERAQAFEDFLARLFNCSVNGPSGCMKALIAETSSSRLAGRATDALTEWVKSLGNDPISKAVERVEQARSVAENMTKSAGNMAMDAANGALKNCFNDMKQRVQAQKDAVDLRTNLPKRPTGTEKGSGGASVGKAIAVVGAATAGTAAAIVYVPQLVNSASGPDCLTQKLALNNAVNALVTAVNNLSACGSSVTCLTSRQGAVTSATSSIANAGGNFCACTGTSSQLSAAEKSEYQRIFSAAGVNPGNFGSCLR